MKSERKKKEKTRRGKKEKKIARQVLAM